MNFQPIGLIKLPQQAALTREEFLSLLKAK
jgi:hypothetical protein